MKLYLVKRTKRTERRRRRLHAFLEVERTQKKRNLFFQIEPPWTFWPFYDVKTGAVCLALYIDDTRKSPRNFGTLRFDYLIGIFRFSLLGLPGHLVAEPHGIVRDRENPAGCLVPSFFFSLVWLLQSQ